MSPTVHVRPRGRGVAKVLDLFCSQNEAWVTDVFRLLSKSNYYTVLLPFLDELDAKLAKHAPGLHVLEVAYERHPVTGRYALLLRRHPRVWIRRVDGEYEISVDGPGDEGSDVDAAPPIA